MSKRYRVAPEDERAALMELRQGMRKRLKIMNRVEGSRKRRKERARARAKFTANPFQFISKAAVREEKLREAAGLEGGSEKDI